MPHLSALLPSLLLTTLLIATSTMAQPVIITAPGTTESGPMPNGPNSDCGYQSDFQSGMVEGWSHTTLFTDGAGKRVLGVFNNNETVILTIPDLTPGDYDVVFDFYAINSWDGDGTPPGCCGPDFFKFRINGHEFLNATFANSATSWQSYSTSTPLGGGPFPGYTDNSGRNLLQITGSGGQTIASASYTPIFHIHHAGGPMQISFKGQVSQPGQHHRGFFDEPWAIDNVIVRPRVTVEQHQSVTCQGETAQFIGRVGSGITSLHWHSAVGPLADGPTPWGSIIAGSATDTLTIDNIQPQDAGLYTLEAETDCGVVESNSVALDVYCDCEGRSITAGEEDGFELPRELTFPSQSLTDVLLTRRPSRPFHHFDEIPGVTPGILQDSRLAHTFVGLPEGIVAATLTMVAQAGSDGTTTPVAEGTDSIRLGFATGVGAAAEENRAWDRRFGGTELDPDAGLLAGQIWTSGDIARVILDLAALPLDRPLGDPTGQMLSILDQINANGFLDVTVVDETGVDFMRLDLRTSSGLVAPWVGGPADAQACEGERAEFSVRTGGVGGPFEYQWRRDGVAIDPVSNPTASEATLVIASVVASDYGAYDCIVVGEHTCGEVTSTPAELSGCCRADIDGDGQLTFFDFLAFATLFAAGDLRADFDGDGELTFFDFLVFQSEFAAGCE